MRIKDLAFTMKNSKMSFTHVILIYYVLDSNIIDCDQQFGPDPWHYEVQIQDNSGIPADLKLSQNFKTKNINVGVSEGFFRRTLGILSKGGQVTHNEDNTVEISLQLRYDLDKWKTLDEYLKSSAPFTEEMYRRSMGYVQDAIYKPSLSEKIVIAWGEYVQINLSEYKMEIIWTFGALALTLGAFWAWRHISHRHMIITAFIVTYLYEGFVSYKEAEQQEVKRFLGAINACKWQFWSSSCEVPPPDPLIFLKYMNPLKIAVRMFTTIVSEPMITINETIKLMILGITDGLWFPFDKMLYGILLLTFNMLIVFLLIMIVFNYILNIPFNLNIFGLFSLGIKQRKRNFTKHASHKNQNFQEIGDGDKISAVTVNKILDVCAKVLDTKNSPTPQREVPCIAFSNNNDSTLKRSASTGRLPDCVQASSPTKYIKKRFIGKQQ